MRMTIVSIAIALTAIALAAVLYLGVSASTRRIHTPDGIAVLEKLELGGLEQWILIRGADRSRPLLLWLHGGPGGAQMPFAHHLDRDLERHFVMVHWDQRGAGKSNPRGFDTSTMRLDQYLDDARELIEHLRRRFGQKRIVLLGHSWGTRLGLELVHRHPEYFHAYIGVSQVVDHARATSLAHEWLHGIIDSESAPGDLKALNAIKIPANRHRDFRELNRLTDKYGGSMDLSVIRLARIAARAPEYTFADYFRLLSGMKRGGGPMHAGGVMADYNFIETIPAVAVPVYFLMGKNDYNTPLELVREYFDALDAPHKELVVFERSAHLPFFAEPEEFAHQLIRIATQLDIYRGLFLQPAPGVGFGILRTNRPPSFKEDIKSPCFAPQLILGASW